MGGDDGNCKLPVVTEGPPTRTRYLEAIIEHLRRLHDEQAEAIGQPARVIADQIKSDRLVYAYGPGGHSNLATQELFFRAGGLMHVSAILDEGTLLSSGACARWPWSGRPATGGS